MRAIERASDSSITLGLFDSGTDSVSIRVGAQLVPVRRTLANTAYFRTLGVQPFLGRFFDANEDRIDVEAAPVAVISHALWQHAFDSDPKVVGSTIRIVDRVLTVVGVTAPGFNGIDIDRSELWMPLGNSECVSPMRSVPWYDTYCGGFAVIGRFQDRAAEDKFLRLATQVAPTIPVRFWGDTTREFARAAACRSRSSRQDKEISISLRLEVVALIVLLITIANASNLLLVGQRREREIAVRRALGVSRWRLFEQLFTEVFCCRSSAGWVAILFAIWAGAALRALLLPQVNWSSGAADYRTAVFAAIGALAIGCLVALVPAVHAWRPDLMNLIKSGNKNAAYRKSRLRSSLLVLQAALSVVLLVGSGLFVRSLHNVEAINLGMDIDRVLTVRAASDHGSVVAPMDAAMPAILKRLSSIHGVEAVAAVSMAPLTGYSYAGVFLPGRDSLPRIGERVIPAFSVVTPGYFRTVGQRIIAGRDFAPSDARSVVVGETVARAYWPGD